MKIWMDINEIDGYARFGHLEGEVDFSEEEEKDFQTLLKKEDNNEELTEEEKERLEHYKTDIEDSCYPPVIDDWEINSWGGIDWSDLFE